MTKHQISDPSDAHTLFKLMKNVELRRLSVNCIIESIRNMGLKKQMQSCQTACDMVSPLWQKLATDPLNNMDIPMQTSRVFKEV